MLRKILITLDGSPLTELALPYGAELARAAGARLTLVRTVRPVRRLSLRSPAEQGSENVAEYLRARSEELTRQGLPVDVAIPPGDPPEGLLAEIRRQEPDLVVMATHGRSGPRRWLCGSTAEAVARRIRQPVLLVRPLASKRRCDVPRLSGKRVLVALDGSVFSEAALPTAAQLARTLHSELVLVRAIRPVYPLARAPAMASASALDQAMRIADAEDAAAEYLDNLAYQLGTREHALRVTSMARVGRLAELIRELNTNARGQLDTPVGVVVMATRGRGGLRRTILGREAEAVLRGVDLPLIVMRPRDAHPTAGKRLAAISHGSWRATE